MALVLIDKTVLHWALWFNQTNFMLSFDKLENYKIQDFLINEFMELDF